MGLVWRSSIHIDRTNIMTETDVTITKAMLLSQHIYEYFHGSLSTCSCKLARTATLRHQPSASPPQMIPDAYTFNLSYNYLTCLIFRKSNPYSNPRCTHNHTTSHSTVPVSEDIHKHASRRPRHQQQGLIQHPERRMDEQACRQETL